ncbi:MAG: ergothioneine biosynthesis protein EgtC [Acidimicrobiia bacterium]
MCRLAAYVGSKPQPLSALLYDPPHSLEHAAYAPAELLHGRVNVDGTGVAWWHDGVSDPLRYVTVQPPWSDPNLAGLASALTSGTILAAVRSATPGLPYGTDNVAPFVGEGVAGAHNGWVGGFRRGVGRGLLARLDDKRFGRLAAMNDSLALFLLALQFLSDDPGASLAKAVASVVAATAKAVSGAGEEATLNLVLARRGEVAAARTSVAHGVNSLYMRADSEGSWLASEALDDHPGWSVIPEHSLVVLSPQGVEVTPLEHEGL